MRGKLRRIEDFRTSTEAMKDLVKETKKRNKPIIDQAKRLLDKIKNS